jgi:hypothetical protein
VGTDLNRNYGFQWLVAGSSTDPCSEVYGGPSQDSEVETLAVERALMNKSGNWDAYISMHAYGQYW